MRPAKPRRLSNNIDGFYAELRRKDVSIVCEIGDRFWGNRDFTFRHPDGYHLIIARPIRKIANDVKA